MLDFLLCPQSVAVIGASRSAGKVGHEILSNLLAGGFDGRLIPVNPFAEEVLGLKCYPTVTECGGSIELTVVAVRAPLVMEAVKSAIAARTKAIAVLTTGFAEAGTEGALLQAEIAQLCSRAGVRLLGPNCLGVINTHHRLNATFSRRMPQPGAISVVSQSGALCTALLDWARVRGLGLAKVVSIGNKADLDETDFLQALAADEQTTVVVGYLESIASGERFISAARAVTEKKPFIMLRGGVTRAGMWVASAHTGNLAGADAAYAAAFRRAGIIRAEGIDALLDYASAFSRQPPPRGDRVGIITNAGGPAVIAADAVERSGMKLAGLNGRTIEKLRASLPLNGSAHNPIDVLGDAGPERYTTAVDATLQDESVDAAIVILTPHAVTRSAETIQAISTRSNDDKPLLLVYIGQVDADQPAHGAGRRLPIYTSPERAVAALHAMYEYRAWRDRPECAVTRFPVNRHRVERILTRHLRSGRTQVGEVETKEILRAYDFSVPEGALANSPEEAVDIAEQIGFPVAMKVVSPEILHKSDVGGIKLNIATAEDVRDTFELLTFRVSRSAYGGSQARVEGVYVEKMCGRGLQVVLGVTSDPRFGPLLVFGLGGAFVDRLAGFACHLAPITSEEAMQMLAETRSYRVMRDKLESARGGHADISAVTGGLQRMSQLAVDFPQIRELSIDPYLVGSGGTEAMVVDARITLFASGLGPPKAQARGIR